MYTFSERAQQYADDCYISHKEYTDDENLDYDSEIGVPMDVVQSFLEIAYAESNEINAIKYIYEIMNVIPRETFFENPHNSGVYYFNFNNEKQMFGITEELNRYFKIAYDSITKNEIVDGKVVRSKWWAKFGNNYAYCSEVHNFLCMIKENIVNLSS